MNVGTGLQIGCKPSAVSWQGSAKTGATSGTSKLWMGAAALPCLEGSWPLALTLGLHFQCHFSCSALQTPWCLSGNSRAQHHIPVRAAATLRYAGAHRDCCSASVPALPALPSAPHCHEITGGRSLKDQCLGENLFSSLIGYLSTENPFIFCSS